MFDLRGWLDKDPWFESGWATTNNGFEKVGPEVERLTAVVPSPPIQLVHSKLEYYSFIHYGMNTFTGREWGGTGREDPRQYNPSKWIPTSGSECCRNPEAGGDCFYRQAS